jgi:hypothetical protein
MSYIEKIKLDTNQSTFDIGGNLNVIKTKLFDGKILNEDDALIFENNGTGSGVWSDSKFPMSVTSGQFFIKSSRRYLPYFSGDPQEVEMTCENFHIQTNVVKRFGYFSSNAVSPFATNYDGFYLESNGIDNKFYFVVSNNGVEVSKHDLTITLQSYDLSKFNVFLMDFLWLGGAGVRLQMMTTNGFVTIAMYVHATVGTGTFTKSPNQKVRYEIRSTTGVGSFTYICSQVSTKGTTNQSGEQRSVFTPTAVSLATIGTKYPIKSIRKKITHRDRSLKTIGIDGFVSSNTDILLLTLEMNPTFSAALTYTNVANSAAQEANGNGTITVTASGTILWSKVITQNSVFQPNVLAEDFLSELGMTLAGVSDELVLCGTPQTSTITTYGNLSFKEY